MSKEVIEPGFLDRYEKKTLPDENESDKEIELKLRADAQKCSENWPQTPLYRLAAQEHPNAVLPSVETGEFSSHLVERLSARFADQTAEAAREADPFLVGHMDELKRKATTAYERYESACWWYEAREQRLWGVENLRDYLTEYMKRRMHLLFLELKFWSRLYFVAAGESQAPHPYAEIEAMTSSFYEGVEQCLELATTPVEGYKRPSFGEIFQDLEADEKAEVRQRFLAMSAPYREALAARPLYKLFCQLHDVAPRAAEAEKPEFYNQLNRYLSTYWEAGEPDPSNSDRLPQHLDNFLIDSGATIEAELEAAQRMRATAWRSLHYYYDFTTYGSDIYNDLQYFVSYYEDEAAHSNTCQQLSHSEYRFWQILHKYVSEKKTTSVDFHSQLSNLLQRFKFEVHQMETGLVAVESDDGIL